MNNDDDIADGDELQSKLRMFFSRYLAGLAGAFRPLGPDGSPSDKDAFFCYSGFIFLCRR
jgi:hypothetical protein